MNQQQFAQLLTVLMTQNALLTKLVNRTQSGEVLSDEHALNILDQLYQRAFALIDRPWPL